MDDFLEAVEMLGLNFEFGGSPRDVVICQGL